MDLSDVELRAVDASREADGDVFVVRRLHEEVDGNEELLGGDGVRHGVVLDVMSEES